MLNQIVSIMGLAWNTECWNFTAQLYFISLWKSSLHFTNRCRKPFFRINKNKAFFKPYSNKTKSKRIKVKLQHNCHHNYNCNTGSAHRHKINWVCQIAISRKRFSWPVSITKKNWKVETTVTISTICWLLRKIWSKNYIWSFRA